MDKPGQAEGGKYKSNRFRARADQEIILALMGPYKPVRKYSIFQFYHPYSSKCKIYEQKTVGLLAFMITARIHPSLLLHVTGI